MNVELLIDFFHEKIEISKEDVRLISCYFNHKTVSKNTILEYEGDFAKNLYFINSGYVRIFHIENGEEITTDIIEQRSLTTLFDSFINGKPAEENLQCISDCDLFYISKAEYENLYTTNSYWKKICNQIYKETISSNLKRTKSILSLSAEERYLKLMHEKNDLIKNIQLKYIASYIGIKPESLSRIRKKIIS